MVPGFAYAESHERTDGCRNHHLAAIHRGGPSHTRRYLNEAKVRLILARQTYIDSLVHRLREAPVRRAIEPVIASRIHGEDVLDDD